MELVSSRPQQFTHTPPSLCGSGCVIILPHANRVYWNTQAALLHGEQHHVSHSFSLSQFVQWYTPEQRELFVQSLFIEQHSFQFCLTIAYCQQRLRYQLLPLLPRQAIHQKTKPHKTKTPAMRAWVGLLRLL